MPDTTLDLPGLLSPEELLKALRDEEDLLFRLVEVRTHPDTGVNVFGFDSHLGQPEPDAANYLSLDLFPDATDDPKRAVVRKNFVDFGGVIVVDGMLRIRGEDIYTIVYRGPEPEWPRPHAPSPSPPPPPALPDHAKELFADGEIAGLPWERSTTIRMPLAGMKDDTIRVFKDATGAIDAFLMITDADIDTDGPGGSLAVDQFYAPETKLNFPGGASCDSRRFPGIVRSVRLRQSPLGLQMGDFVFICYKGKAVACQVYDQGPDDKIGEISIFAARQVGGVPPDMSEHRAATKGNFTSELVTLCFPGSSPNNQALSNSEIIARATRCLEALTKRSASAGGNFPESRPLTVSPAGADPSPTIHARSSWGALPPKSAEFAREQAQGIVIHNTEDTNRSPKAADEELRAAFELSRRIQHSHMFERGWWDVGQHFTISRGGIIMEGRAGTLDAARSGMVVQAAHAGSNLHNRRWWGIEIEGDFRKDAAQITDQQHAALNALCAWLSSFIKGFDSAQNIKAHREVKAGNGTDCPGKLLDPTSAPDFLDRLRLAVNDVRSGQGNTAIV